MPQLHTLSIMVRNKPGVLTKIAGMFYRRDYNIKSLTVGTMHTAGLSKIVISVPVDDRDVELLRRQIENLVDVQGARLLDRNQCIFLEVCLIRLAYRNAHERRRIIASAQFFQPRIRRISDHSISLEITESPEIVNDFVEVMSEHEIFDVSRTGATALGPDLPVVKRDDPAHLEQAARAANGERATP